MDKKKSLIVKGIAIILMLFHHLFLLENDVFEMYQLKGVILSTSDIQRMALESKICVSLFVFITGYGLVKKRKRDMENHVSKEILWFQPVKSYVSLVRDLTIVSFIAVIVGYVLHCPKTPYTIWEDKQWIGLIANCFGVAGIFKIEWFNGSWWYVSVAITCIFLFPLLYDELKKYGPYIMMMMAIFVVPYLFQSKLKLDTFFQYFPTMMLAMIIAEYDLIEKLQIWADKIIKKVSVFITLILCLYICFKIKENLDYVYLVKCVITTCIVLLSSMFISLIPLLNKVLEILGVYSRYMWLIHVFIMNRWFHEELYSLGNVWLIWIVLIISSFLFSFVLTKTVNLCKKCFIKNGAIN